jgi:hypothetical protein
MRHKPPRRRVKAKLRDDRTDATHPNQCWSMDFMADELFDGRHLRPLTIVDNFSRVTPLIGVGFSYGGYDVVSALNLAVANMERRSASGWTIFPLNNLLLPLPILASAVPGAGERAPLYRSEITPLVSKRLVIVEVAQSYRSTPF